MVADLHRSEFASGVLANLIGFTDGRSVMILRPSHFGFALPAPHGYLPPGPLAFPQQRRASPLEQVLPHQGVGKRLLVGLNSERCCGMRPGSFSASHGSGPPSAGEGRVGTRQMPEGRPGRSRWR